MSEARAELERRCAQLGIATGWHDIWGRHHAAPEASLRALAAEFDAEPGAPEAALPPVLALREGSAPWRIAVRGADEAALRWRIALEDGGRLEGEARAAHGALEIGAPLAAGYHRLSVEGLGEALVISAPERCWRPAALENGGRVWGPALQLYALRSRRNWGMGDFGDLRALVEQWAARGASVFGLNPLHALYPHNPAHASPYSPSSRLLLNVMYLDVEAIEDCAECEPARRLIGSDAFQARLAALRAAELVDYPGVAAAKFEVLELLFNHFWQRHLAPGDARAQAFLEFRARGGEMLHRHALYDALQERFFRDDPSVTGWQRWPEAYHDPAGEAVARFALVHAPRVAYFEYLQWQAELQLSAVAWRCAELGLELGLYLDLAVSVDRAGSDAWAHRDCYALGASVGAPPDDFNLRGQDWGLPPLRPDRLRATGYELYASALREAMSHAGALRIDHVMGLMRLFWIPAGAKPAEGAYVHYALEEMLAILALESHRNRCLVIGEDLGTVPDEVRAALARYGVLSYRLLWFERDGQGEFRPPAELPREALVAATTHDLPTLAGWWRGTDLELRRGLGQFPDESTCEALRAARAADRARLARALERAGLEPPDSEAGLAKAVHAYLAAAPSRVMMVQLEDLLGVDEQANLPGTTDEQPNWRRKLPLALEDMAGDARAAALGARLSQLRPRPARAP